MSLLSVDHLFHATEARLFTGGPTAFVLVQTQEADARMADAGAIKPFSYECASEGWGMFKLTVSEVGRSLRTDAQRVLVRARARSRHKRQAQQSSPRRGRSA